MSTATMTEMLPAPPVPSAPVRVAIVSASPAVRSGIRALIDGHDGISVVAEALAPADATLEEPADVLVGEAESHMLADWRAASEDHPLVLLGERDALLRYRSMLQRPVALLLREAAGPEIAAAVLATAHGLAVAEPSIIDAPTPAGVVLVDSPPGATPLSVRELQVLRLVATGLPNKAIALNLGISEHTVKFHIGSIMGKLDASSRTEAVTLAVRQGLLPL